MNDERYEAIRADLIAHIKATSPQAPRQDPQKRQLARLADKVMQLRDTALELNQDAAAFHLNKAAEALHAAAQEGGPIFQAETD